MNFLKKIKILFIYLLIIFFSKLDKIIKTNLEGYFSYLLLCSNHPNRIHEISKKLKLLDYWKNEKKCINSIFFINLINTKKKIIFIGDSQTEYLSRIINDGKDILSFNSKSLWLGTSLVVGLNSNTTVRKMINKVDFFLNGKNYNDKIAVIALGTIDIRAIFYEFLVTKTVKNESELLTLFTSGMNNFIKNLRPLLKKRGFKKIGIIEIFNTNKDGQNPKNYSEIKKIKMKNPYPTFGSKSQREIWSKKANKIIKKLAKKNEISFISNQMHLQKNSKKILNDGIHLSSKNLIQKINENIINIDE